MYCSVHATQSGILGPVNCVSYRCWMFQNLEPTLRNHSSFDFCSHHLFVFFTLLGLVAHPFPSSQLNQGVATDKVTKCGANDIPEIGHWACPIGRGLRMDREVLWVSRCCLSIGAEGWAIHVRHSDGNARCKCWLVDALAKREQMLPGSTCAHLTTPRVGSGIRGDGKDIRLLLLGWR